MTRLVLAWSLAVPVLCGFAPSAWAQNAGCIHDLYGRVHCAAPESQCLPDRKGEPWCSPAGGAVELTRDGQAACGVGACTKSQHGDIFCSTVPRGGALTNSSGQVACVGGCAPASARLCVKPQRL